VHCAPVTVEPRWWLCGDSVEFSLSPFSGGAFECSPLLMRTWRLTCSGGSTPSTRRKHSAQRCIQLRSEALRLSGTAHSGSACSWRHLGQTR